MTYKELLDRADNLHLSYRSPHTNPIMQAETLIRDLLEELESATAQHDTLRDEFMDAIVTFIEGFNKDGS